MTRTDPITATPCAWCLKPRRSMSEWEQKNLRGEWNRLCKPCARVRLNNPYNALLGMRKVEEKGGAALSGWARETAMPESRYPLTVRLSGGRVRHMARQYAAGIASTACGKRGPSVDEGEGRPLCAKCAEAPNPIDCRSYNSAGGEGQ